MGLPVSESSEIRPSWRNYARTLSYVLVPEQGMQSANVAH